MKRLTRVNELLKREIGMIIERYIAPEVESLITVTQIKTSPDLRQAAVFVSVYGGSTNHEEILMLLKHHRVEIQKRLAKNVTLKYTPVLRFFIDDNNEKADRIYNILNKLNVEEQ